MITHKIKNILILVMSILLLISGTLNFIQLNSAKREQIARMLDFERSNTIIAGKTSEIEQIQGQIESERKQRRLDSLKATNDSRSNKATIARLMKNVVPGPPNFQLASPDSMFVMVQDSIGNSWQGSQREFDRWVTSCVTKDTVISTQALMITSLEVEKEGMFYSFNKEIALLQEQREAQVDISNQLQNQLVDEQGKTRKSERWRKFWKRTTGAVVVAAATVVTIVTLKE